MNSTNTMLTAALEYADLDLAVFPLGIQSKAPHSRLAPQGFKNATTDQDTIRAWWSIEPNANIGIACGNASNGIFVIDIDNHNANGKDSLNAWQRAHSASLPKTLTGITGGNGLHYYFRSNEPVGSRINVIPGVDIKGDGGYIVAPPSIHPNGNAYQWEASGNDSDVQIAEADETTLNLARCRNTNENKRAAARSNVTEGERNNSLASHLGGLRRKGWSRDDLEAEALRFNQDRNTPPLDKSEALKVARSIASYPTHLETMRVNESFIDMDMLERLVAMHPEDESRYKNTELGWSYLYADMFKNEARFCPERKAWMIYDGTRWKHDSVSLAAGERAKILADTLYIYLLQMPEAIRKTHYESWGKWQRRSTRDTILKDAAGVYPISISEFDADPYLLNVQNGTLNLKTGELQPHHANDLITKLAPVTYDHGATFPRWCQFIDEIMSGDKETALFLQKCFGYALSGSTKLEKMFVLYGITTRNGKGTLDGAVLNMLGDYAATADSEMLSTLRNTGGGMKPTEDLARLDGIRYVSISEFPKGMTLDSAKVKNWTGSDRIKARFLGENSFEYKPQFKLFLSTNDLPVATDSALFKSERMIVTPFNRHFTEAEQDHTLKHQFSTGAAKTAILNWMLEGWRELQISGFAMPNSVAATINEYRIESDMVTRFVSECLEVDANGEIKTTALLSRFNEWASLNGFDVLKSNSFKGELTRAGLKIKRCRSQYDSNNTFRLMGYKFIEPSERFKTV